MAFADLIVGKWNRNLFPWFTPGSRLSGCISFVSYIKPQPTRKRERFFSVVYLSFPTSNHNPSRIRGNAEEVVYLSFPTSNHNLNLIEHILHKLYIFRFLHQTTTYSPSQAVISCCISFVSYIKPQLY